MSTETEKPPSPLAVPAEGAGGGSRSTGHEPEPEVYSDRWEQIWGAGLSRGQRWDAAGPSPALLDLLQSGKVDVKGSRVLVPGCGRGYDLPVFMRAGAAEVVGLELSPTAVREAEEYLRETMAAVGPGDTQQQQGEAEQQAAASGAATMSGIMRVEGGDFFHWEGGRFDVGYDYTFGCAMHPSDRQQWAASWSRHVRSGGVLVTLVFPVAPEADPSVGPPFPVSPQLYTQLLESQGFEATHEAPVSSELSHPARAGKEVMMVWIKK